MDERIAGKKPVSISFAAAAALPLTTIFDRLRLSWDQSPDPGAILIVGGAGGWGSIAVQLVKCLTGMTIIATASRAETVDWCKEIGAHHVVDHRQPLAIQVRKIVPEGVRCALAFG